MNDKLWGTAYKMWYHSDYASLALFCVAHDVNYDAIKYACQNVPIPRTTALNDCYEYHNLNPECEQAEAQMFLAELDSILKP